MGVVKYLCNSLHSIYETFYRTVLVFIYLDNFNGRSVSYYVRHKHSSIYSNGNMFSQKNVPLFTKLCKLLNL